MFNFIKDIIFGYLYIVYRTLNYLFPNTIQISDKNSYLDKLLNIENTIDIESFEKLLDKAAGISLGETILILFYIRDKQGRNQEELGRIGFRWLFREYPQQLNNVFIHIPEYGCWNDLYNILDFSYKKSTNQGKVIMNIINYTIKTLRKDKQCLKNHSYDRISDCAIWFPSEMSSTNKITGIYELVCDIMEISHRDFRRTFISPLRNYLRNKEITENKQCYNIDNVKTLLETERYQKILLSV